jgi:hypothetical protein
MLRVKGISMAGQGILYPAWLIQGFDIIFMTDIYLPKISRFMIKRNYFIVGLLLLFASPSMAQHFFYIEKGNGTEHVQGSHPHH